MIPDPNDFLLSSKSGDAFSAVKRLTSLEQRANNLYQNAVIVNMLANYASAYFLQEIWAKQVSASEHNASARSITDVVANTLAYAFALYQHGGLTSGGIEQLAKKYEESSFTAVFKSITTEGNTYTSAQLNGIKNAFCSIRPDQFAEWGGGYFINNVNYAELVLSQVEHVTTTDDNSWNNFAYYVLGQMVGDMSALFNSASYQHCPTT